MWPGSNAETAEHVLEYRYRSAKEYLEALDALKEWEEEYHHFLSGSLTAAKTMALLSPEFYGENAQKSKSQIRGNRAFLQSGARENCQSQRYWGYECPFDAADGLCADHVFPYSLGGITAAPNLIWLCRLHNRLKGSDVHVFPWEAGVPDWVAFTLGRILPMVRRVAVGLQAEGPSQLGLQSDGSTDRSTL